MFKNMYNHRKQPSTNNLWHKNIKDPEEDIVDVETCGLNNQPNCVAIDGIYEQKSVSMSQMDRKIDR
jgi:hypothetical protein